MNNRRRVLVGLGIGALAAPFYSWGQQPPKVYRLGILGASTRNASSVKAFLEALRTLGYIEGQNLSVIARFADGHHESLPALARELVAENVDIIFAATTNTVIAAMQATSAIPIVFSLVSDPVGSGFVQSLNRPGGRVTGATGMNRELSAKRVEVLRDAFPKISRIAVLSSDEPQAPAMLAETQKAAKHFGMQIQITEVRSRDDFERASKQIRNWRSDAIYVIDGSRNGTIRPLLAEFAAQLKLPAIYADGRYADDGGLITYGMNYVDLSRRAAHHVDKIFKGANPADLPVEQPTRFEMVINLKTAKALGIKIPSSMLVRADRVIQ